MPKLSSHKKDEVYKNIMGSGEITPPTNNSVPNNGTELNKTDNDLDKLVHKSYYITKRHVKALKIRTAFSDKPEEKDFSAIVRAALDLYLADDLKNI